ncbi:KLTH0F19954p [Lachancea thermotolerans CBS 6340]|uniref:KLTH0F19954p n=1 Tax=Lachancea thermotolerans (strain ATCC 56472 / CBS 6340 / NRRL Y-8284) TaxID=559295 RepID=C5DJX8_LACTC|nr:KLTH0F19954p [Lachancea thermotolerans CBS 6340]CAR24617.1 KLTH0F19954p [Lachancea thermotolerans CBS 6340]
MMSDAWGLQAKEYAEKLQKGPPKASVDAILQAVDSLLPFEKAKSILDNGCGTGLGTQTLIDKYGHRLPDLIHLVAADLSPGMIESVRMTKAAHKGNRFWDRLELQVCSVDNMSKTQNSCFSHIIASLVFFFAKPEATFSEAYRILQPGGVIGFTSFRENQWMDLRNVVKEINPGLEPAPLPAEWASEEWIRGQLEKANFIDIKIEPMEVYVELDDSLPLATLLVHSGIPEMSAVFQSLTDEEKDRAVQLIVEELAERYPKRPAKIPGILLVSSARKQL